MKTKDKVVLTYMVASSIAIGFLSKEASVARVNTETLGELYMGHEEAILTVLDILENHEDAILDARKALVGHEEALIELIERVNGGRA